MKGANYKPMFYNPKTNYLACKVSLHKYTDTQTQDSMSFL